MSLNNTEEMSMENNDPMITAVELEQEILGELNNGVFRLKNGIPLGVGDDCEMQYDVTFRELTAGDVIELRCGASVLRMDSAGHVTINGTQFSFEASGPVQITGKDVDIN